MGSGGRGLVAVGAYAEEVGGVALSGAVHVFRWNTTEEGGGMGGGGGGGGGGVQDERFDREVVAGVGGSDGKLVSSYIEGGSLFGWAVAVYGREGGEVYEEYVVASAPYEEESSELGNVSLGLAVKNVTPSGSTRDYGMLGGVYVFGGRPLAQIARLKPPTQYYDRRFGMSLSVGVGRGSGGGVLAIGGWNGCEVSIVDLW